MIVPKYLWILIFWVGCSLTSWAHGLNAEQQFEFARACYQAGDLKQAVYEYKRFLFFFPQDQKSTCAVYNLAMLYFNLGQFNKALEYFNKLKQPQQTHFMIARTLKKLKRPWEAVDYLEQVATSDPELKDQAFLTIAWLLLDQAAEKQTYHPADFSRAYNYLTAISVSNRKEWHLTALLSSLDKPDFNSKNPVTAGLLSVLPGGGYLYTGRYHDALIAFLFNAGWMLAAGMSFDQQNHALGGLICLVGTGFYSGSIYGSVNSAYKFNRQAKHTFMKQLKANTHFFVSHNPDELCWGMSFQF